MKPGRLIKFEIPAAFVVAHAIPTAAELAAGFIDEWLDAEGVVCLALAKLDHGMPLLGPEERLALLLSDEYDEVQDIIGQIPAAMSAEEVESYWLLMALAWLLENRSHFEDPLAVIEMLYADFDYPTSIEGLVRYMPPPAGGKSGLVGLEHRWSAFIQRRLAEYARRTT